MVDTVLKNTIAPSLPVATQDYEKQYEDQYSNILRLYFNQIDNYTRALASNIGGSLIRFPNGAFYQDGYTTLTAAMSNVSTSPIQVVSTDGFIDSGGLLIGTEIVKYTGRTATTFTGITRGAYGSTNTSHAIGVNVSEAQTLASSASTLPLTLLQTTTSNGVSIDPTDKTKVIHSVAGIYNIQFSIQMLTFDNTIDNVTIWFRKNGVDIPYSAGIATVPAIHAGNPGTAIISWNLVESMNAGDYIQILFASNTGNTVAATYPPGTTPVHPASPSIILTSTFVSALY